MIITKTSKIKAEDIVYRLCLRHPKRQWVVASELHTSTGTVQWNKNDNLFSLRSIDFFALNVWPSENFQRVAYEIKVSRSDWISEIKNPTKRAQAYYLSNAFYFVLLDSIFRPKEDNDKSLYGCGILLISKDMQITEYRKPLRREAWPIPEYFMASFLRNIRDTNLSKYQPER